MQILNAGLLHAARKGRPETRLTAMGLLLMLLPASGAVAPAVAVHHLVAGRAGLTATEWAVVLIAGALSAVAAWVFAPWCLGPIAPRGGPPTER